MTLKLLRGGTVLVHNDRDQVEALHADVLIRDGVIDKVEVGIKLEEPHEVLDCVNKLISPGFVDTHHHVWQTQLKGLHAEHTLLEYLPGGNMSSSFYNPDDVFYGQLAGCLEAINGGITTFLDFSHINYSPENVFAAIQATLASGVRSVYAYCPTPRVKYNATGVMQSLPFFEPWIMDTFEQLAAGDFWGRVSLGFAFDGLFLPPQVLKPVFDKVHSAPNVHVITMHDNSWSMFHNKQSGYADLVKHGLLDPKNETNWVLVHPTKVHELPIEDVKRGNVFISITPVSELSMGMGTPVPIALNREHDALASQVSIGIDCHTIGEAFMPGQLRSQLLAVRQYTHAKANEQGKWFASMDPGKGHFAGVQDAFNLATLGGARALGMADKLGRIKPGYRADLVLWDTKSPSMLAVAEQDPIAAIVIHSQPADVFGVIVDGAVRKWDGRLRSVQFNDPPHGILAGYKPPHKGELSWDSLADQVLKSRGRIMSEVKKIDMAANCAGLIDSFHLNKQGLIDPVGK